MSARNTIAVIGFVAAFGAWSAPSSADDNGLGYMHDISREGGRNCFADHYHYGSGSGANKAAALRSAIVSWQDFTAFEYGSDWARWGKAASKQVSCSKGASGVDCSLNARPCK